MSLETLVNYLYNRFPFIKISYRNYDHHAMSVYEFRVHFFLYGKEHDYIFMVDADDVINPLRFEGVAKKIAQTISNKLIDIEMERDEVRRPQG